MPLSAVGSSASTTHFRCFAGTVRHSLSFLGRADKPAWSWLSAGGRCCWPVAFRHTVREGLVAARLCLQVGTRQCVASAAGAGGDDWVECGRKLRARWPCAFR